MHPSPIAATSVVGSVECAAAGSPRASADGLPIRRIEANDSIADLTALLHRAYAPLAAAGMRFLASHQDEAMTRERVANGECYVAVLAGGKKGGGDGESAAGRIVGTVVFIPPWVPDKCAYYSRPEVAWFQQFAVEPEFQRRGVGARLMDVVEARAAQTGAAEIALDTSERATRLIAYYRRRGYEIVDYAQWDVTNYRSVIMRKCLSADTR